MKFTADQAYIINLVLSNSSTDNVASIGFEILNLSIETNDLSMVVQLEEISDIEMLVDVLDEENVDCVVTETSVVINL